MTRNKTRIPTLTSFNEHSIGIAGHSNQTRKKKINQILIGKEEVKVSMFADDMIPHIQNPKDATKKLLELIEEISKVAGYKINIQKSVALVHTDNKLSEREINKIIPFIIP